LTQTTLILGANRGIGLGLVRELLARGDSVIATARNPAQAHELAGLAETARLRLETADILDPGSIRALPARLAGITLDRLVLNAGIFGPSHQDPALASDAECAALMATNAFGPIRAARALAPLVANDHGVIAFISSALGSVALNTVGGSELYRASKAALNSLARSLATELRGRGITVLSLSPGWVRTEMGGDRAPLSVETSTRGLAEVLVKRAGTGENLFLDYAGNSLAW
jgi:NAD(P)-dependent dehydrogenase (short-subunit alcohol dehydrogenase family)